MRAKGHDETIDSVEELLKADYYTWQDFIYLAYSMDEKQVRAFINKELEGRRRETILRKAYGIYTTQRRKRELEEILNGSRPRL